MKLGRLKGGTCLVCGSDTFGNSIGCGCIKMYDQAKFIELKKHPDISLQYNFGIEMKIKMDIIITLIDKRLLKHKGDWNKSFRTEFNRNFNKSIYEFYKDKGFVSKKQLEVMERKWLTYPDTYDIYEEAMTTIDIKKKELLKDFEKTVF